MDCEFEEDIGTSHRFFLKTNRTYSGEIKKVSERNFIHVMDEKLKKVVRFPEDNIGSSEPN